MNADEQERIMKQNDKDYGDWVCVVRCKDCKFYGNFIRGICDDHDCRVDDDDFCSYGERKNDDK